jgi:polysaccharide export outer membrane protein
MVTDKCDQCSLCHLKVIRLAFLGAMLVLTTSRSLPQTGSLTANAAPERKSVDHPNGAKSNLEALPAIAPQDISNVKLTPGSAIEIHVFEEPDLDGKYRIDARGNILLPLAGSVRLGGMTIREAEGEISRRLIEAQILKVASVVIDLDQISVPNVTVAGEVTSPGVFNLLSAQPLGEVLSMAGGETQLAGSEIIVEHNNVSPSTEEIVNYNRNENDLSTLSRTIEPGDSIYVKKAGIVYVLGAVGRPGGYVMQEAGSLNVDQALALAMGTSIEAKTNDIRVFRKMAGGSLVEMHVSYKAINSGKAAPIALKAEDIIYVPPSRGKEVLLRGGISVINAAATAAVYSATF